MSLSSSFFSDSASTAIYTLSLHDALPILPRHLAGSGDHRAQAQLLQALHHPRPGGDRDRPRVPDVRSREAPGEVDRKSTRLNSSHTVISYAVFCLKKENLHDQVVLTLSLV